MADIPSVTARSCCFRCSARALPAAQPRIPRCVGRRPLILYVCFGSHGGEGAVLAGEISSVQSKRWFTELLARLKDVNGPVRLAGAMLTLASAEMAPVGLVQQYCTTLVPALAALLKVCRIIRARRRSAVTMRLARRTTERRLAWRAPASSN